MCIRDVKNDLPLFVVVFDPYGNPNVFLTEEMRSRSWQVRRLYIFHHTSVLITDLCVQISISARTERRTPSSWLHACLTNSLANQALLEAETKADQETPINQVFTYYHLLAMDPCTHPSILSKHSQFLIHGSQSQRQALPRPATQLLLYQTTRQPLHATAGLVDI